MKVTFFSNFLNHHQLPLCFEMYRLLGNNFKFVATEYIHEERLKMGYKDMSNQYPFTLNTYKSHEEFLNGLKLGDESDIVIIGSAPDIFIKNRLKENKIVFRYSERIFKKGQWRIVNLRNTLSLIKNHTKFSDKNVYMLCASAYTAADFNLVGAYRNKSYRWGYFPEAKEYNIEDLLLSKENMLPKLLWVGRLIKWKHPEYAIEVADKLKQQGWKFTLDIIGSGEMESDMKKMIKSKGLEDCINLLGSMSPDEVRIYMESANIFVFTSDFNEGWGAVLNEAMNSGCAVITSHSIGSAPFLIKNNINGLIYENGNINSLLECVRRVLESSEFRKVLGVNAYNTIVNDWNAKKAAERFLYVSENLLADKTIFFDDGICSKSEILTQRFIY